MSSDDELWSNTSSSCDVESLELAVEGEDSYFDCSALSSWVVEEGEVTEGDEDGEDGMRFVTFESRFENKETVLNW